MAIAPEGEARHRPALSDMPHKPAQMSAHFNASRRLARSQHHRDGAAAFSVVDVDRQEAAFVIMGIEQRQLLMAVHDIAGVVDIGDDGRRLAIVGRYPLIDQCIREADSILQGRRVLQPRQGRLRAEVRTGVGKPPAGELERRISAQEIQIVGIFIAARNGEDAGPDHVGQRMSDTNGHLQRPTWAHSRMPIDLMVSGNAMRLFQPTQIASMMSS
jgi:hypothetical protein